MERNIETLKAFEGMQADMQSEYVRLLDFADTFKERQRSERSRLPYQLNVIDELHINENAHSRILLKLLQYQTRKGNTSCCSPCWSVSGSRTKHSRRYRWLIRS